MRMPAAFIVMFFFLLLVFVPVIETASADNPQAITGSYDTLIHLKYADFDPLIGEPMIPSGLEGQATDIAMVQYKGPVLTEWRDELARYATILAFLKDHTFIVFPEDATSVDIIRTLPGVRWVGAYHPAYKIHEDLITPQLLDHADDYHTIPPTEYDSIPLTEYDTAPPADPSNDHLDTSRNIEISIKLFRDSCDPVIVSILARELGLGVSYNGDVNYVISAISDPSGILKMAHLPWVEYIQPTGDRVVVMDNIRNYTGADGMDEFPYDGEGVVGEVKDNGIDQDHPEFIDQLIGTDGNVVEDSHGTSTFGIVFAKGVNDQAMGMAPGSKGVFCDWAVQRYQSIMNLVNNWDGVFQSNSWYQGDTDSSYSFMSAEDDQTILDFDVTMLYATGNGGAEQMCSQDAVAKNVIAVGGIRHGNNNDWDDDRHTGGQGNRGPADDGRIKPDLCGPYESIYTTSPNGYTSSFGGTSGATPVNAGGISLIYDMYEDNHFSNNPLNLRPHAATVKALAIANAHQYDLDKAERMAQGWGHIDVGTLYDLGKRQFILDEDHHLIMGGQETFSVWAEEDQPLKISLVWSDFPGAVPASQNLVNDLDLLVVSPSGVEYRGNFGLNTSMWSMADGEKDELNNVENVFIQVPENGEWQITVTAAEVVMDADTSTFLIDQPFSLVASGVVREDHDLVILDHQSPEYFEPYVPAVISVDIANFGEEDAADVEVRLMMDDEIVDSGTIDTLRSDSVGSLNLYWTPDSPAIKLLQIHVVPLIGERKLGDNWYNETVRIFHPLGRIIMDLNHTDTVPFLFRQELINIGFQVYNLYNPINGTSFNDRTAFLTFEPTRYFTEDEQDLIEEFVRGGGGLLAVAGENNGMIEDITAFAGIGWSTTDGQQGSTNEINVHPITESIESLNFETSELTITTTGSAEDVVMDEAFIFDHVLVAASTVEKGNVVAISDGSVLNDSNIYSDDNLLFGINIADWINDQPPIVTIASPVDMSAYDPATPVSFSANVADPDTDIDDLTFYWNSSLDGYLGDEPSFQNGLQRGQHEIRVTVSDNYSSGVHSVIIIMNSLPVISLEAPAHDSYVEGMLQLQWHMTDEEDDPIDLVLQLQSLDGEENRQYYEFKSNSLEIDDLPIGKDYTWQITGTDPFSRDVWSPAGTFRYGNSIPVLQLDDPEEGVLVPISGTTLSWDAFDPDNDDQIYTLYLSSDYTRSIDSGPGTSYDITELEEGKIYEWWVEVDDGYDTNTTERRSFQVNNRPTVTSIHPDEGQRLANAPFNVSVSVDDADGNEVMIKIFLDGDDEPFVSGYNDVIHEIQDIDPGDYSIIIELDDGLDPVTIGPYSFSINHDPSIHLIAPFNKGEVNNTFTLSWSSDDPDQDTLRYYLYLGPSKDPDLYSVLDETEYNGFLYVGSYYWYVIAQDTYGRTISEMRRFTIPSGIRPDVRINTIGPDPALASERIFFSGTAEDGDGVIETIQWSSDIDGFLSSSFEFDIIGLSPGTHKITMNATDDRGNVGSTSYELRILDSSKKIPTVAFIPTASSFAVNQTIFFTFVGSGDPDGTLVGYHIDFGDGSESGWIKSQNLTHRYSEPGSYTLIARVRDDDGLISRNPVKIIIHVQQYPDPQPEDGDKSTEGLFISSILLLVIGVPLIIIIGFMLTKRGDEHQYFPDDFSYGEHEENDYNEYQENDNDGYQENDNDEDFQGVDVLYNNQDKDFQNVDVLYSNQDKDFQGVDDLNNDQDKGFQNVDVLYKNQDESWLSDEM